ncbi:hypothetical protein [Prescottella sp. R16]|uniref:hypothetical protein n=1 Tax=Prescottella sp. R16 TaxID=3064529 RepID=UPI00272EAD55|nr:hypothetical protein [Prescottella sp. R16]
MTRDVEKRWSDPRGFRAAVVAVAGVIAVAAVILVVLLAVGASHVAIVIAPSAVLLLGGIGLFVQAYRAWRRGGVWPIWQGAGWFVFVFALVYLGISVQSAAD